MATETKRYEVIAGPNTKNPKGMWKFEPDGGKLPNGEPTGVQVYVEIGGFVDLRPEAAQPLVDLGRLRLARGRKPAAAKAKTEA